MYATHAENAARKPTKYFYVSAIDGPKKWLMAGPYTDHQAALNQVHAVAKEAADGRPQSWWYAWGTCGSDEIIKTPLGPDWK
jgi:hypothetical protein